MLLYNRLDGLGVIDIFEACIYGRYNTNMELDRPDSGTLGTTKLIIYNMATPNSTVVVSDHSELFLTRTSKQQAVIGKSEKHACRRYVVLSN